STPGAWGTAWATRHRCTSCSRVSSAPSRRGRSVCSSYESPTTGRGSCRSPPTWGCPSSRDTCSRFATVSTAATSGPASHRTTTGGRADPGGGRPLTASGAARDACRSGLSPAQRCGAMATYSGTNEFEGATFVRASFKGATVRFSDVSGVTMRGVDVGGLDIDSHDLFFGSLFVNGVDVVPLVDAELDRQF